jgi:hypothetical protein
MHDTVIPYGTENKLFYSILFYYFTLVRSANGDADQILPANYQPYLISQIFFLFGPRHFLHSEPSVRK